VAELLAEAAQKCARIAEDQLASQPDPSVMGDVQSALDQFPGQTRFFTVRDLSEVLGVDQKTIRRWRQRGDLPAAIEVGGVVRWRPEVIDSWILEREAAQ
jgi:predicted DNA-binding transcriptional regulator AlpA